MKWVRGIIGCVLVVAAASSFGQRTYLGFDKNGYPGDDLLPALHRTFAYTGYWLNDPPGMSENPWAGKRGVVRAAGLGFLILFNGRLDAQLQGGDAASLGREDASVAIAAAKLEGFRAGAIIFLDQEEGGSLLPEQAGYISAWIAAIGHSEYRVGLYCSAIAVASGSKTMSTAQDIEARFPEAKLWVWNDQCPPAPGCVAPAKGFDPAKSGTANALVWQYAQSPRRPEDTAACQQTYAADGRCYAPDLQHSERTYIDMNVSRSPDPSHGR
jgi:glycoside hydrolase-like protein